MRKKIAIKIFEQKLLPKVVNTSCQQKLLTKVFNKSCEQKLWTKIVKRNCVKKGEINLWKEDLDTSFEQKILAPDFEVYLPPAT